LPQSERKLIKAIAAAAGGSRNPAVQVGVGDDCSVLRLRTGHELLVTTDFCIEGVHFRREWHPPEVVGHHCLTRGLSDIAAMGGEPVACFLSLGLPPKLPQSWIKGFLSGLLALAREHRVQLAGGDTSSTPQITADIVLTGQVPAGTALLRSGARPGDRIFVTGSLGASGAALKKMYAGQRLRPARSSQHFFPQPRLEAGQWVRKHRVATAMIDLSDGLSVDLAHICEESGVSATVSAEALPIARGADLNSALHGGEDYELLFTAAPKARVPDNIAGLKVTEIGHIEPATRRRSKAAPCPLITLVNPSGKLSPLEPLGWEHFRS